MKADIGRVTFDPRKHYQRVVLQQGRVQLEADWNEQASILVHGVRQLAADLIGPWGGSQGAFAIDSVTDGRRDFSIGAGHYYVDGILCDNDVAAGTTISYLHQPWFPVPDHEQLERPDEAERHYLAYLDVWELLVTAIQDDDIRELALGGPDTAARTRVVWQARVLEVYADDLDGATCETMPDRWRDLRNRIEAPNRGRLRARARAPEGELDRPCAIDPQAAYRFDENALFRVEVHEPGDVGTATFKFSVYNAVPLFAVQRFAGTRVQLATLGRDSRLTLEAGDWVELENDTSVLQHRAEPLFQVEAVDYSELTVTLDRAPAPVAATEHPRLRRWDQKGTNRDPLEDDGTVLITEVDPASGAWIDLRHGVQVQLLSPRDDEPPTRYRTGDYWMIPARTAIGDVLWPKETGVDGEVVPIALPPDGVEHHYAPLAHLTVDSNGAVAVVDRYVRTIGPLAQCPAT